VHSVPHAHAQLGSICFDIPAFDRYASQVSACSHA
jgi:hypothetical protein